MILRCWAIVIIILLPCFKTSGAKVEFFRSQLPFSSEAVEFADLNGDQLMDMIVIQDARLLVFIQDGRGGFSAKPQIDYLLGEKPVVLCPLKAGDSTGSKILMLTEDGLSTLSFVSGLPTLKKEPLITEKTLLDGATGKSAFFFPLALNTKGSFPLLLLPTAKSLEIWRYSANGQWRHVETINNEPQCIIRANNTVGYQKNLFMNLAVGDIDGDKRDDLVIREVVPEQGVLKLKVYHQTPEGGFPGQPTQILETCFSWHDWIGVMDLNRDGRADLIKGTWLVEPWFIPGTRSGKVIVHIFLADAQGKIDQDHPAFIFRKNDWQAFVPITDIDSDGFPDLILGYYHWKGRDAILRSFETRRVDFELRLFFFNSKTGYPMEPDTTSNVRFFYDRVGPEMDFSWSEIFSTDIKVEGDFNGDGQKDLLYREGENRLAVRFFKSREEGFDRSPSLFFPVSLPREYRLNIRDLNHDNISDLIVLPEDKKELTIFLSKIK